jgi:hypothetical protein
MARDARLSILTAQEVDELYRLLSRGTQIAENAL